MKLTIEKIETTKTEVEIVLPHYRRTTVCYFKVYSETKCLQVTDSEGWYQICQSPASLAFCKESTESTEDEFLEKFDEVYFSLLRL